MFVENKPGLTTVERARSPDPTITGTIFPNAHAEIPLMRGAEASHISVSEAYPVREDIRFIGTHREKMTSQQLQYYLRENVVSFLGEFAGGIPFKPVRGLLLPDELQIGGFDMLSSGYNAVAFKARHGIDARREEAELVGLTKIHKALSESGATGAVWHSAAKIANYRMVFAFEKGAYDADLGGHPIAEVIVRKDEAFETIDESKREYRAAKALAGQKIEGPIQSAEDLLREPIRYQNGLNTASLLTLTGLTNRELQYSSDYENTARTVIEPILAEYIRIVGQYKNIDVTSIVPADRALLAEFQSRAEPLIDDMFRLGAQVKRYLNGSLSEAEHAQFAERLNIKHEHSSAQGKTSKADALRATQAYALNLAPVAITSGSLCPSWMTNSGFSGAMNVLSGLGFGVTESYAVVVGSHQKSGSAEKSYNGWKKRECVKCPECAFKSTDKTPHLFNGKEWICGEKKCRHHKRGVYNDVVKRLQ